MKTCVICRKELQGGSFSTKDKFELAGHSYICKACAAKIGIKNIFSASAYTAEKAVKKYLDMYPDEQAVARVKEDIDDQHIVGLMFSGKQLEAIQYVMDTAAFSYNKAAIYVEKVYFKAKVENHPRTAVEAVTIGVNHSKLGKNAGVSTADELIKLKGLLDQGILTQEEFDAEKKNLLHR